MENGAASATRHGSHFYLIGGGIASLAAAAFLIRDGDVSGCCITLLEQSSQLGGSLDGGGSAEHGYVIRGGRMLESKYLCTYDLFSSIPALGKSQSVTQEIFAWNQVIKTSSKSRLVRGGHRLDAPEYGLTEKQMIALEVMAATPEAMLGASSIADHFDTCFFETNFWLMWCTTFAFQPWHSAVEFKRYLLRFAHLVAGFNRLQGVMRTIYEQYDSMVRPLRKWLDDHGVNFELNTRVTDLVCAREGDHNVVKAILYTRAGLAGEIKLGAGDAVIATLGSMTEGSSLGSMDSPPVLNGKTVGGAWTFWEKIAAGRPEFGRPSVFTDHIDQSKWVSFTTTLHNSTFFRHVRDLTSNVPGEGGLVTLAESSWLASIVLPHQPHFLSQPKNVDVFWGYGLAVDKPGDFVNKPMAACTGREIMTEILGHLQIQAAADEILERSNCIPCMMPFITSQFLCRKPGDRPDVVPRGWANLAFTGQFCELPDDVVFTVEYSVRSAQTAVYTLLHLHRKPPAVYKGQYDPRNLYQVFAALHDIKA